MTCKKLIAPLALLLLTGCATLLDRSTQLIHIDTPGTQQAFCELKRPGFRSRDFAPTTLRVTKSRGPMTVTCIADGNRQSVIVIKPALEKSFYYNAFNLGVGAAYDYETDSMWKYPDTITIDFTNVPPRPMPLPEYQVLLKAHPEIGGMEEFRPGVDALPSDRGEVVQHLQERQPGDSDDVSSDALGDDSSQVIQSGATIKGGGGTGPAPASSAPAPASSTPVSASPGARSAVMPAPLPNAASVGAVPTPVPAAPPGPASPTSPSP